MLNILVKEALKKILWDYNIAEEEAILILEGKKKTFSLNKEKLYARLLLSVKWYSLLDMFGREKIKELLSDKVLKYIRFKDIRDNFIYARRILDEI